MPDLVIELVVRLLFGLHRCLLVKLEIAIGNGFELHELGVHCPQVVNSCSPLLVELLLNNGLSLFFSPLFQLIGAHGHLVHALLGRLLAFDHLPLIGLHLGRELVRELLASLLQGRLVLGLHGCSLALDAVAPDDSSGLVLPEALLLDSKGVELLRHKGLVDELLLLPLHDGPISPDADGNRRRHGSRSKPRPALASVTWRPTAHLCCPPLRTAPEGRRRAAGLSGSGPDPDRS
mmetsp:Transcript_16279/g.49165  ORF Transcript_16279/g.49165 Transcript_16279/m.49165 type:complete len:234 (+) Transcript_16279:977-1678(+)